MYVGMYNFSISRLLQLEVNVYTELTFMIVNIEDYWDTLVMKNIWTLGLETRGSQIEVFFFSFLRNIDIEEQENTKYF